jgi:uncharacterized DUF497 family protein
MLKTEFDPAKAAEALAVRGVDFNDATEVFDGPTVDIPDERRDYGERRTVTVGFLNGRMFVVVWTQRGAARRIISMRKANVREQARFGKRF